MKTPRRVFQALVLAIVTVPAAPFSGLPRCVIPLGRSHLQRHAPMPMLRAMHTDKAFSQPPSVLLRRLVEILDRLGGFDGPALTQRSSSCVPDAPEWLAREGWDVYLRQIEDSVLERAEITGLRTVVCEDPTAPSSLRELVCMCIYSHTNPHTHAHARTYAQRTTRVRMHRCITVQIVLAPRTTANKTNCVFRLISLHTG